MSTFRLKFTKNTDPALFEKVIQRFYPDLQYDPEQHLYQTGDLQFPNSQQLLENLAEQISDQSKITSKFSKYANFLENLSKRKKNDRTCFTLAKVIRSVAIITTTRRIMDTTTTTIHIDERETTTTDYYPDGQKSREQRIVEKGITETTKRVRVEEEIIEEKPFSLVNYEKWREQEVEGRVKPMLVKMNDPIVSRYADNDAIAKLIAEKDMVEEEVMKMCRGFLQAEMESFSKKWDHFDPRKVMDLHYYLRHQGYKILHTDDIVNSECLAYAARKVHDLYKLGDKDLTWNEKTYLCLLLTAQHIDNYIRKYEDTQDMLEDAQLLRDLSLYCFFPEKHRKLKFYAFD